MNPTPGQELPLPDPALDLTRREGLTAPGRVSTVSEATPGAEGPAPDVCRRSGSWLRPHLPAGVLLTLLAVVAEGRNVTRVGFLSDDLMLLAYYRHGDAGAFNPIFWMHRPFGLTFQWLLNQVFGYSAPAHQLAILVVHLLGAVLVYALCVVLSRGERLWSLLVAALFLVFPLDETVPWVSFAPQRLAMVMWLAGTLLLLAGGRRLRRWTALPAMLLFAFAVLTNEMYLSLTVLTGVAALVWEPATTGGRRPWLAALGAGAVVGGYVVWRFIVAPRFTSAVDWRGAHFVLDPRHWLGQAYAGFKVPLATAWAFGNSPDSFGLAAEGWLPVVTVALLAAAILGFGVWYLSRDAVSPAGVWTAGGRVLGGLVVMGCAMLPFLPTRSDLRYSMLTATRNHYTINLGASVVLISLALLAAVVSTRRLRLSARWTHLVFGALCVPPLVLGVLAHRRAARELGEVADAQRHLACALWHAAPDLAFGSYVFLRGIGLYPCPLQPLDAEWTVTGLVQLMYEDASLGGTLYVKGAITDEAMGPLAIAPPDGPQVKRLLSRLAVLRYTDGGFVSTRRLPAVFVRRGLPEKPGSSAWIGRWREPSAFVDQYLCGCSEGAWPSPMLSAERPDDLSTVGVLDPETGLVLFDEAGSVWQGPIRIGPDAAGFQILGGDWTGSGVDGVGTFGEGMFTLFGPIEEPGEEPEVVATFRFGRPGDLALAGDWDGDGVDTVAVFRDGMFYFAGAHESSPASGELQFGGPGDLPLAGDWNGDGVDTVGVFRDGAVLLAASNSDGGVRGRFRFGQPGDLPVAGDWDGDGVDTLAVKREDVVLFRDPLRGDATGFRLEAVPPGVPIAGDWDGD